MKTKLNNLKKRFELTEEQKAEALATTKTLAKTVVVGIVANVAISYGSEMVKERIEDYRAGKTVESEEQV